MANPNRPHGFVPVGTLNGAAWNGQTRRYFISASDTNAYYVGDPVVISSGGSDGSYQSILSQGVQLVTKAAAGDTVRGVISDIIPDIEDLEFKSIPATKKHAYFIDVVDDPTVTFEIQADGDVTPAALGSFANFTIATPTNKAQVSNVVLATSTISSSATSLPLRILGLAQGTFGLYARLLVQFNMHDLASTGKSAVTATTADVTGVAASRIALGIIQQNRTGDSVPVWQGGKSYALGDRIFPTAYNDPATWTTGFKSAGGALYCLMCVTAGVSAGPTFIGAVTCTTNGTTALTAITGTVQPTIGQVVTMSYAAPDTSFAAYTTVTAVGGISGAWTATLSQAALSSASGVYVDFSGTGEPQWKDPATISHYGYLNSGTGAGLLDITDNTVTWRIRPAIFIDPLTGNNTGATRGTQLNPYLDWSIVSGTMNNACPWSSGSVTIGNVYNDDIVTTGWDATNDHQVFAGACFLQRAGTTATGVGVPALTVQGPYPASTQDSYYVSASSDTASPYSTFRLTFGCYRLPSDVATKAYLTRSDGNSTGTAAVVFADQKTRFELLDLDVSNSTTGNSQNGVIIYTRSLAREYGNNRIHIAGCNFHHCLGGSGIVIPHYGGNSSSVGVNGIWFEDCNSYENMGMGFYPSGNYAGSPRLSKAASYSVKFDRCTAWNNGKITATQFYNHGFSAIAHYIAYGDGITTGATGWTNTSGNIWRRTVTPSAGMVAGVDDIPAVTFRSGTGIYPGILRRNTATPTTPATGEYGFNGTYLYINLGGTLYQTLQTTVQLAKCQDLQYNNCESFGQQCYQPGGGLLQEGFGFAADAFVVATYTNCFAHHNQQSGFFLHYGTGSVIRGCHSYNNGDSGIFASCARNSIILDSVIGYNGKLAKILNFGFGANTQGAAIKSIYQAANTIVDGCMIFGSDWGVVKYNDPTSPYPGNTFPYLSTIVGGRNRIAANVGNYGTIELTNLTYGVISGLSGDTPYLAV